MFKSSRSSWLVAMTTAAILTPAAASAATWTRYPASTCGDNGLAPNNVTARINISGSTKLAFCPIINRETRGVLQINVIKTGSVSCQARTVFSNGHSFFVFFPNQVIFENSAQGSWDRIQWTSSFSYESQWMTAGIECTVEDGAQIASYHVLQG